MRSAPLTSSHGNTACQTARPWWTGSWPGCLPAAARLAERCGAFTGLRVLPVPPQRPGMIPVVPCTPFQPTSPRLDSMNATLYLLY